MEYEKDGIYAVVKRYGWVNDEEPNKPEFEDWFYRPTDFYSIYDKIMELTDNDHEIASGAASWCELATVGEIYEFREGEVEIQYVA